ncbi:NADH-cytochrome b5 reductase-like [Coemansia interrupta]|uniref:NADH-cytochrome b5 reductase-like n=1 Tax=Coemansia interrupta TaxID=1126814 RepID=A0A9W8LIQ8_9FUNG|nr:NADH-cytochrome b5 reductase-like [Coemansia interrupta]
MNPAVQTLLDEIAQAKRRAEERRRQREQAADGGAGSAPHVTEEPQPPSSDECCGNGCTPCVFDTYHAQLLAYRQGAHPPTTGQLSSLTAVPIPVLSSRPHGARAQLLVLDATPATFVVGLGEHVHLRTPQCPAGMARAFTPVLVADGAGVVRPHVLVRRYEGGVGRRLAGLRAGDLVMVRGPLRSSVDMTGALGPPACVLVAAGTGIALAFHVLQFAAANSAYRGRPVVLVQCACDRRSLWLQEEIRGMQGALPGLRYHVHVSGDEGRLDSTRLAAMLGGIAGLADAAAVVCGPEGFNRDVARWLRELGLAADAIQVL